MNKPLLLIVCDSLPKLGFFRKHLKKDFDLIECRTERSLLENLESQQVDFIILDEKTFQTPLDEVCRAIRATPGYEEAPLLIITSQLKKSHMRKLLSAGASDFLSEPLNEIELMQRMTLAKRYHETHKKMARLANKIPTEKKKSGAIKAIKQDKKYQKLSILMLEIGQIKPLVEKWGALAVEEALVSFDKELKKLIRFQDEAVQMGRGKYIVLMPGTSKRAAETIAEDIKEALEAKKFDTKKGSLLFHLTIAIATHEVEKKELASYQNLDHLLKKLNHQMKKNQS